MSDTPSLAAGGTPPAVTEAQYIPQGRVERLIATGRVVLAASSLLAIWLDPSQPEKYAAATYALMAVYVAYAMGLAGLAWGAGARASGSRSSPTRWTSRSSRCSSS